MTLPSNSSPLDRILNKDTLLPIGVVLALLLPIVGASVWMNTRLLEIDHRLSTIQAQVQVTIASYDRSWTVRDMQMWIEILRAKNSTVEVPGIPPR